MTFSPIEEISFENDLSILDGKLNAILPSVYQYCYEQVQPDSMGSASLKMGADGKVAWDEIWTTFCDLALAGGPPHRGTLLEPACAENVWAQESKYQEVVVEIGRGLYLTTRLPILPRFAPGWIGVRCAGTGMAAWLRRALVAENILARHHGDMLHLPAGPDYRLAREVKNVITALAKTCHYWTMHMPPDRRESVAAIMDACTARGDLIEPAHPEEIRRAPAAYRQALQEMGQRLGPAMVPSPHAGWIGVRCDSVPMAVWLLRALIVEHVLARREENVLYVPVDRTFADSDRPQATAALFRRAGRLWQTYLAQTRE